MILERIKELAQKATPGPWIRSGVRYKVKEDCLMVGPDGFSIAALPIGKTDKEHSGAFKDAAYIAALSPEVVLAMVEAIEAAKVYRGDNPNFSGTLEDWHIRNAFDDALAKLEQMK